MASAHSVCLDTNAAAHAAGDGLPRRVAQRPLGGINELDGKCCHSPGQCPGLAPARTSGEIVAAYHAALLAALADAATVQKLVGLGTVPATPEEASPAGLAAYLGAEIARYRQAAELAGLKPQ